VKTAKQSAIKAIRTLPDDSSYEDIMERLFLSKKLKQGLKMLRKEE